jgi:uncharacterized protein YkwD
MADADLPISQMNRTRHRRAVKKLVDEQRRAHGLKPLRFSMALRISAHRWVSWMLKNSSLTHGNFSRRSAKFPYVIAAKRQNRRWRVGEALVWGSGPKSTPRRLVQAWMNSPEHRKLLLGDWMHGGVWSEADAPKAGKQPDAATVAYHFGWRGKPS